jgi:hypothetical protein
MCGHAASPLKRSRARRTSRAAATGVIQQRALDGRRGPHPPAVVRADDRFGRRIVIRRTIGMATKRHYDVALRRLRRTTASVAAVLRSPER